MLQRITLHLARNQEFPEGSPECGYEIIAPLDEAGRLDAEAWKKVRDRCRVRRFWAGDEDQMGQLVHDAGGAGGATWKIDYDPGAFGEDEAGYRLDSHRFVADEYVSIRDAQGHSHTFKIAEIRPV